MPFGSPAAALLESLVELDEELASELLEDDDELLLLVALEEELLGVSLLDVLVEELDDEELLEGVEFEALSSDPPQAARARTAAAAMAGAMVFFTGSNLLSLPIGSTRGSDP